MENLSVKYTGQGLRLAYKMSKEKPKLYIIRKYVKANNVTHALRLEKKTPVHDCWIEEKWQEKELPSAIGFDNGIQEE